MPNLEVQPGWPAARQLDRDEFASGGPNGNLNEHAKVFLARTEYLQQQKANKSEIVQGVFEFGTYAEFNAIKSTLPLNCTVVIGEENTTGTGTGSWAIGSNRWNGTILEKSKHDPLTQSKNYSLDLSKLTESVSAAIFGITGYINKANGALVAQIPPSNTTAYFLATDFIPCAIDDVFIIFTSQLTSGAGGHCIYDTNKNFVSSVLINPNVPHVYKATSNGYLRFTSKEGLKPYVRKLTPAKVTNAGSVEEKLTLNFSISGYINHTGEVTTGSGESTDFIDVSGYDLLKIESQTQGITRSASTAFYDADKVFLGRLSTVDDTFNVIDVKSSRVKYLRTSNAIETIKISGCSINKIIGTEVSAFKSAIESSGYYFEDFNSSVLVGLPWVNNSYVNKNTGALVADNSYQYVSDIDISAFTHIAIYDETPSTNTSGSVFKKSDSSYISQLAQDPFKLKVVPIPVGATKLSVSRYAATKFYIIGLNQKTEKFKLPFLNSAKLVNPVTIALTFPFDGFYIRRTDGFMINSLGFSATDFIDISAYPYIELSSYTSNTDGASPCFYDSNKQYISDIKFRNRGDKYVIKRPEGAVYIRLVRRYLNYLPTLSGSSAITMDNEYLTESGESKKQALAQFNNTPVGNTADVNNAIQFLDSRQGFVDFQAISTGGIFLNNTAHLPLRGVFLALYNEQPIFVINGTKYALNLTKLG